MRTYEFPRIFLLGGVPQAYEHSSVYEIAFILPEVGAPGKLAR
jgi:hypothetical protein